MSDFFTKPLNADAPVDGEWEAIEQERQDVENALAQNAIALSRADAQTVVVVSSGTTKNVQTSKPTPRRTQLLAEQRRLLDRRNEIYLRRAALKEQGESR
jgi:hypothetical protein